MDYVLLINRYRFLYQCMHQSKGVKTRYKLVSSTLKSKYILLIVIIALLKLGCIWNSHICGMTFIFLNVLLLISGIALCHPCFHHEYTGSRRNERSTEVTNKILHCNVWGEILEINSWFMNMDGHWVLEDADLTRQVSCHPRKKYHK